MDNRVAFKRHLLAVITCPPVPEWSGVISIDPDAIAVRSIINVTCVNDSRMTGEFADDGYVITECMQSGTWEPELPECVTPDSEYTYHIS